MSPARAAVLVGLFALLLVVYFGLEWRTGRVAEREAAAKRLFDVKAEEVTGVRLERPDEAPIVLAKQDGRWRIAQPRDLRADQEAVARVVRAVAEATRERTLEGVSPANPEYGLGKPAVTVTLETPSGARTLSLGAEAKVGYGAFARRGGAEEVVVVPASVKSDAAQSLFDLRDKRVVAAEPSAVRRIEVRPARGGEPVVVVNAAEGKGTPQWRLEGVPAGREAEQWRVDRLADAALDMRMSGVAAETREAARGRGLESPARTVTLVLDGGATRTITIGGRPAKKNEKKDEKKDPSAGGSEEVAVAVEGEPEVYLVPTNLLQPLEKSVAEMLKPLPSPSPSPAAAGASPGGDAAASPAASK
jgi:Domain of unknown function (DUF4340)